jgi:hypothetical protein
LPEPAEEDWAEELEPDAVEDSEGSWVDELEPETLKDSAEFEEASESKAAATAASAFLARCLRRSCSVVAIGCPSLSSLRDSGNVPKTCLKRGYLLLKKVKHECQMLTGSTNLKCPSASQEHRRRPLQILQINPGSSRIV